eukprot:364849-Chlamydomonas_euryale.AAC.8
MCGCNCGTRTEEACHTKFLVCVGASSTCHAGPPLKTPPCKPHPDTWDEIAGCIGMYVLVL